MGESNSHRGGFIKTFILFSVLSLTAHSRPLWLDQSFSEDDQNFYFSQTVVAGEQHCRDCYEEARRSALIEMVRTLFGTQQKFDIATFENQESFKTQVNSSEKVPLIKTQTFREKDRYFDKDTKSLSVQFMFSKREYQSLLERSSRAEPTAEIDEFVEINGSGGVGVLYLTSEPSGAAVFIDGERWGETPLIIKNKLKAGIHALSLDQHESDIWNEDLIVTPNEMKVHRVLAPGKMKISIDSSLPEAEIFIDGVKVGKTPKEMELRLIRGKQFVELRLSHDESFGHKEFIHLEKDARIDRLIDLPLKPGRLVISCNAYPCSVAIDGGDWIRIEKPSLFTAQRGSTLISASRTGYQMKTLMVDVLGGSTNKVPPFEFDEEQDNLSSSSAPNKESSESKSSSDLNEYQQSSGEVDKESPNSHRTFDSSLESHHRFFIQYESATNPEIIPREVDFNQGFGYEYDLKAGPVLIGGGLIFLITRESSLIVERGETGYGIFAFELFTDFRIFYQIGLKNRIIEDEQNLRSFSVRQTFKSAGFEFVYHENKTQNNIDSRALIRMGGSHYANPFSPNQPIQGSFLSVILEY